MLGCKSWTTRNGWIARSVSRRREKKEDPPRTRCAEVQTGDESQRVFVIDSDKRRAYEQGKRTQAMERTRASSSRACGTASREGALVDPAQIGAAAERALQAHNGYRYFTWDIKDGIFAFTEHPLHFEREKRLEGRYVIATSKKHLPRWMRWPCTSS